MISPTQARLGELAEPARSITYDVVKPGPEQEDGVLFVRGGDVLGGRLAIDALRTITSSVSAEYKRTLLRGGELLVSLVGNPGEVAIAPETLAGANIARQVGLVALRPEVNAQFVMYYLMSPRGRADLFTQTGGAVQQVINLADLKRVVVPLPSRLEQDRIADILSAYDNLIDNNRRRMALLEEAARQLYREWFVRLRFPGHEHTRIIDGVPERWERKPLRALADFRLGKMLDQNKNKGDLMPYLANINIRWDQIDLHNLREMRFEDDELDTFGLCHGDIVMCEGGEPGRCAIWKEQLPNMMIQKAVHRIRAHPCVSYLFLYYSLRHKGKSGQMAMLFTGATIKHLPREKLALVGVDVPPQQLIAHFVEQVDPIERQVALLEAANRRASHARDLLLPRLMSGEIAA